MDFLDFYESQATHGPAGQSPSLPSSHSRYISSQPGAAYQQQQSAINTPFLDLGDLDDIIQGDFGISPDAAYLSIPQTTLPVYRQPPSFTPTTVPPAQSPVPTATRSLPSQLHAAGVVDLGVDPKTREHRFRLPFPSDVDKAFEKLRITVGGKRGFHLDSCVGLKHKEHYPNSTILKSVDHASMVLDRLIPGRDVVIQRAAFPGEELPKRCRTPMEKEPQVGFTLAHLLTIMCKKQYDAEISALKAPERLGGRPRYEWLWVVSVARSNGNFGPVRWFPELEVRIPPKWWDASPANASRTLTLPSTPHSNHRSPHTPRSPPQSPTSYSPYPSPHKTQPQQSHSDRLHKRTKSAVGPHPHPVLPQLGPSIDTNIPRPPVLPAGPILLPLPEGVDPRTRYPIYIKGNPAQRGVCLHNIYATARDKLLEHLRQTVVDADKPLVYGHEMNCTIVERGFFPGERRGHVGRPIKERSDTGYWTLADILVRIMVKQREWYRKDLRGAEVQNLIAASQIPAWLWWAQRGMHEDLVWLVAIRQTLPDHQGLTRWIPEIELRDR